MPISSCAPVHQEMAHHWATLEADPDCDHVQQQERLSQLSPMSDTTLSLPELGPYLEGVAAQAAAPAAPQPSIPSFPARVSPDDEILPELVLGDDANLALIDLEAWVHHSLDRWVTARISVPDAGPRLATLTARYLTAASKAYDAQPKETSVLILTAAELWVALDRCTISQIPLLGR